MRCPCGSEVNYDQCCGRYVSGGAEPPTAEALMRSRYVAYVRNDIGYVARTTAGEALRTFDARAARAWSAAATWIGLQVLATDRGGAKDNEGTVEFVATYRQNGEIVAHRERSRFQRAEHGEWRFVEGSAGSREVGGDRRLRPQPGEPLSSEKPRIFAAEAPKAGRNDPCVCGSGKKFKKCCGAASGAPGGA